MARDHRDSPPPSPWWRRLCCCLPLSSRIPPHPTSTKSDSDLDATTPASSAKKVDVIQNHLPTIIPPEINSPEMNSSVLSDPLPLSQPRTVSSIFILDIIPEGNENISPTVTDTLTEPQPDLVERQSSLEENVSERLVNLTSSSESIEKSKGRRSQTPFRQFQDVSDRSINLTSSSESIQESESPHSQTPSPQLQEGFYLQRCASEPLIRSASPNSSDSISSHSSDSTSSHSSDSTGRRWSL